MTDLSSIITQIRELLPKVPEGEWKVYDGCSWRRIGTTGLRYDDQAVLSPTIASDGHPDLISRGGDRGDILSWIALLNPVTVSALLERIEELERELTDLQTVNQCYTEDFAAMKERAITAESRLSEARAESLEEAARECLRHAKSEMPITRWDWHPWIKGNLQRVTRLSAKTRAKAFIRAAAAIRALKSGGEETTQPNQWWPWRTKYQLHDRLMKAKGSSWQGHVVGFYATALTPVGYCIESEREPGSVQIYPESALERVPDDGGANG